MALKSGQLDMNSKLDILSQHIEHILRAEGEIEETENLFKLLVEYYPLEEAVHGYYAAFLQHMKRDEEAVVVYESMLNINPSNKQTWLNIIQIYFSNKIIRLCFILPTGHWKSRETNSCFIYIRA